MSTPREPEDVKLIISVFSMEEKLINEVIYKLEKIFGRTDWISPKLFFDRTKYYAKEMGWPLHRRFISFYALIKPEGIADVKLATNALENGYLQDRKRKINIDPGYISLERMILASGKNFTHRIYLSKGVYGDLTLIFQRGSFRPLEWTYNDYADPEMINYFNVVRAKYKKQIEDTKTTYL